MFELLVVPLLIKERAKIEEHFENAPIRRIIQLNHDIFVIACRREPYSRVFVSRENELFLKLMSFKTRTSALTQNDYKGEVLIMVQFRKVEYPKTNSTTGKYCSVAFI